MTSPPIEVIRAAVSMAAQSDCAKSRRGAAVFVASVHIVGIGHNGPPPRIQCDGSEQCRESCGERCAHAEHRAIRQFLRSGIRADIADVVHVKIDTRGELVAGGPPSCMRCAVEVLDVGLGGVWLYQEPSTINAMPIRLLPDGHDRFHYAPTWLRYTADEFYWATCDGAGCHP